MSKALLSGLITDIRGKFGGSQWNKNKAGNNIGRRANQRRQGSGSQNIQRSRQSNISKQWRAITQTQRDAWNSSAELYPQIDRFGNPMVLSGYNWFIRCNQYLQTIGEPFQPDAPGSIDMPQITLLTSGASAQPAGGLAGIEITWTFTGPSTGKVVSVFASPAQSQGIGVNNKGWKQMVVVPIVEEGEQYDPQWIARYQLAYPGQKIFQYVRIVDTTFGVAGNRVYTAAIAVST